MPLPRTEVVPGLTEELGRLSELVRSLDDAEFATPSRNVGWTTGDTAAHVAGTLADIIGGRFDGLGTPEATQRAVDERRGRTAKEIADELDDVAKVGADLLASFDDAAWAGPAPAGGGTLGYGVEALWYDAYVHGEDIRAAVGRPATYGRGLRPSVSHVLDTLEMQAWAGTAPVALDSDPKDQLAFVLAATGRADPATLGLDERVNIYR